MMQELTEQAAKRTRRIFGNTIKLFVPLYLSNECINICTYCGFRRDRHLQRKTLTLDEVFAEAEILYAQGHRHLLLVSGEHPKAVSIEYLESVVRKLKQKWSNVSLEIQPYFSVEPYQRLVAAGADGMVIYQETYDRDVYRQIHPAGPKQDYDKRLQAIDFAGKAGARTLGIGALLGLADWRRETQALITHARTLMKRHWRSQINVSFPRITAAVEGYTATHPVSDRDLMQMICIIRLALPEADLILSTRERPELRDQLIHCGITKISAGSSTEPGGYSMPGIAGEQFHLEDRRTPQEVADMLRHAKLDPVWKDWEAR